jgi:cytochrome c peroxidase
MSWPMRFPLLIALTATPCLAVDFRARGAADFEKHCYECHGAEKQKNDYRLDIKAVALKHVNIPGKSRKPAVSLRQRFGERHTDAAEVETQQRRSKR